MEVFTAAGFSALLQVIAIDLVLAGDNAIVIGLAAAGLPTDQRKKAILVGIAAATILRIAFALITQQLLQIGPILLIAGGLLRLKANDDIRALAGTNRALLAELQEMFEDLHQERRVRAVIPIQPPRALGSGWGHLSPVR